MRPSALLLAIACAATFAMARPAFAQAPGAGADDLRRSGLPDAPSWWAGSGLAGWTPDARYGALYPWTLAGLARGGWSLSDARSGGESRPWPGVLAARATLAAFDSLSVGPGGDAAWQGFDAALVPVHAVPLTPTPEHVGPGRSLGEFSFARGSSAISDNCLAVVRDDSLTRIGIEAVTRGRGAVGAYGDMGMHRYGVALAATRGAHQLEGAFAQRGSAMSVAGSAAEQSASGASGSGGYAYTRGSDRVALRFERATLNHESFGQLLSDSRRDQSDQSLEASWNHERGASRAGVRALAWKGQVRRRTLDVETADTKASGGWLAAHDARPLGRLQLSSGIGLGSQTGSGGLTVVPSLMVATRLGTWRAHALGERVATPVWSDLAPGQDAFLQDTWTAAAGLARDRRGVHVAVDGRLGYTEHRAVAPRLPIEELWLRSGWRSDPDAYRFALATAELGWRDRSTSATVEGFVLGRDGSTLQANVDPAAGARLTLEGGRRFFRDDLGVTLRLRASALSERQGEASPNRRLAPYATLDASVVLTLVDVIVVIDMVGIEDRPQPLTWIDPRTGTEALGAGFENRIAVSWRLFD